MEIVLTALLVSVILGTASAAQNVGAIARVRRRRLHRPGRPVVSAGQRHLDEPGPLVRPRAGQRRLDRYWVYVVGPLTGAPIAVGFAYVLRGRGGDPISQAAGSGVLDEGALTAKAKLSQDIEQGKAVPPGITGTGTQQSGQ